MSDSNVKGDRYTLMSDGNSVVNDTDSNNGYLPMRCHPNYVGRFDAFLAKQEGYGVIEVYKNNPQC